MCFLFCYYLFETNRPVIDIVIILDIRILATNTIFSKLDGQRRALWIITKSTVEERAFDILCKETNNCINNNNNNNNWMDIWQSSETLRNTMCVSDLGIGLAGMEDMIRGSTTRAISFLFRSASLWKIKQHHSTDTTGDDLTSSQQQLQPSTKRARLSIPAPLAPPLPVSASSSSSSDESSDATTLNKQKGTESSPYIISGDDDDDDDESHKSWAPPTPVPEQAVKTISNKKNATLKYREDSIDLNHFEKRMVDTIDQVSQN